MFLRGYGKQAYNGKTLSSGETGSIQNFGSPKFYLNGEFFGEVPGGINAIKSCGGDFKYVGGTTNTHTQLRADREGFYNIYQYTIGNTSPCGIASLNEIITLSGHIARIDAAMLSYDSTWKVPDANEVRPVNVAVRYYIKAK